MLERHELEAFLTLAEELHFGRTAERLHVSTARISQTIAKLERRTGCRCSSVPAAGSSRPRWAAAVRGGPARLGRDRRGVHEGDRHRPRPDRRPAGGLRRCGGRAAARRSRRGVPPPPPGLRRPAPRSADGRSDALAARWPGRSRAGHVPHRRAGHRHRSRAGVRSALARRVVEASVRPPRLDHAGGSGEGEAAPATGHPARLAARGPHSARHPRGTADRTRPFGLDVQRDAHPHRRRHGAFPVGAQATRYYGRPDVAYIPISDAPPLRWGLLWRADAATARVRAFAQAAHDVAASS